MTDLDAVDAMLEEVTPGPWTFEENGRMGLYDIGFEGREIDGYWENCVAERVELPDARFIAAARELVPALATEVRALRAERDARIEPQHVQDMLLAAEPVVAEMLRASDIENEGLKATIAALEARVEALTGALAIALAGLSWAKAQISSADAAQKMPPREHPPIDRALHFARAALSGETP